MTSEDIEALEQFVEELDLPWALDRTVDEWAEQQEAE